MALPLNEMSDHSKIVTFFKSSIPIRNVIQEYNWNQLKTGFKWNSENKKAFADGINNNLIKPDEFSQRLEAGLVNSTGEKIQNLYIKMANLTLGAKRSRPDKNWKKGCGSIRIALS